MKVKDHNNAIKVLVVAIDDQTTVARITEIVKQSAVSFDIIDCISWPYVASTETFDGLFERFLQEQSAADVVLLHRVLFSTKHLQRFFALEKPTVFDFDDALYAVHSWAYVQERQSLTGRGKHLVRWLWRGRSYYGWRYKPLVATLKQVTAVSAGNPHLAQFAAQYCSYVQVVPTAVDVTHFPVKEHCQHSPVVIGWYGAPLNQWYLDTIAPALKEVANRFGDDVRFQVISSKPYSCPGLEVEWIRWQRDRELEDLLNFDIGLMPLTEDEWARGKSGNKAIYYMGLGINAVVSPVGMNAHLITHGETGFHAEKQQEWVNTLSQLIKGHEQRKQIARSAREHILKHYSREVAANKLGDVIHWAAATVE